MRLLAIALCTMLLAAPACSKRPATPPGWPLPEVQLPPGATLAAMPPLPVAPESSGQTWSAAFNWRGDWEQLVRRYDRELAAAGYKPYNPLAGFGQTKESQTALLSTRLYIAPGKTYNVLLSNGKAIAGSSDPEVGDYVLSIIEQGQSPLPVPPPPPPAGKP